MTEKNYNPEQNMKGKGAVDVPRKSEMVKAPVKTEKKTEVKVDEDVKNIEAKSEKKVKTKKKPETKIIKKDNALVNGISLPISTKQSVAICKFIKGKTIREAVDYLERVIVAKRPIPMRGEIPHRKNQDFRIMSGRFPKKASENFIMLLKSLGSNSVAVGIENPVIIEAYANMASKPHGRFGRTRKKRSHITLRVKDLPIKIKNKKKK